MLNDYKIPFSKFESKKTPVNIFQAINTNSILIKGTYGPMCNGQTYYKDHQEAVAVGKKALIGNLCQG